MKKFNVFMAVIATLIVALGTVEVAQAKEIQTEVKNPITKMVAEDLQEDYIEYLTKTGFKTLPCNDIWMSEIRERTDKDGVVYVWTISGKLNGKVTTDVLVMKEREMFRIHSTWRYLVRCL